MTKDQLIALARQTAAAHGLEMELVCAVVEQESSWDPFAFRYEPAFFDRYVAPLGIVDATEARGRAFSWGLMQLMGETARERGYAGKFLANLCDPWVGLEFGCRHLANRIAAAGGNIEQGLQLWNGGGNPNYPSEVMAKISKYETETAT